MAGVDLPNRCNTCRHWGEAMQEWEMGSDLLRELPAQLGDIRRCSYVPQLWDAASRYDYVPVATVIEAKAFVTDGEQYFAALWTRPEFGCVMHEDISPA